MCKCAFNKLQQPHHSIETNCRRAKHEKSLQNGNAFGKKKHQIQHEMQSLFRLHFFPSTMQVTRREEKKLDGASLVATKMKAMLGGLLVHTQLQAHQLHFISLFAMFDYRLRP